MGSLLGLISIVPRSCSVCLSDLLCISSIVTLIACSPLLHVLQRHSHQLEVNFEAPLKEFVRMVKSAKNVMQDRSTALTTLQQVRCNTCCFYMPDSHTAIAERQ